MEKEILSLNVNINISNLTEEEKETLMSLIEKGNKPSKIWQPGSKEKYYVINSMGSITECYNNTQRYTDAGASIGNVFRTEEEAEFALEKLKVYTELKKYALEHNEQEIDWGNMSRDKYIIICDCNSNNIEVANAVWIKDIGQIYFSSEKIVRKAIKAVGEDRIKKYLFNVQ